MTRFALAGKCGFFGASGDADASLEAPDAAGAEFAARRQQAGEAERGEAHAGAREEFAARQGQAVEFMDRCHGRPSSFFHSLTLAALISFVSFVPLW
jgi:hypothetical protein